MPRKIKWGVIGSGGIARRRTIPEGIGPACNGELTAVYDVNEAANLEVAEQYGAAAASSLEELLASEVEAVYIGTPAFAHHGQALAAVAAGKHVLCEKPLGMSVAEAEEMIAAARKAGVQFGTAFMMRFHSQHKAASRMVAEGKIGAPVYGRAQLSCWYPPMEGAWRQVAAQGGGGSLMDMGGHCIDLLEMAFGPVAKVACFTNNTVHAYGTEDSAVAMLSFENGALATVDAFFCVADEGSKNRLELYGTLGSILAEGTIGQGEKGSMVAYLKESAGGYDAQQMRDESGGIQISPEPVNMYRAEIEEFGQAILDGRAPSCSAEEGLRSQKILAACYESAKAGTAVAVR